MDGKRTGRWIAMVNVGFIGEGDSEQMVLESRLFKAFCKKNKIHIVGVFNAGGGSKFKTENDEIGKFFEIFDDRDAEKIFILTDSEEDPCITFTRDAIFKYNTEKQIDIVAVKALEAWFLADTNCLKKILGHAFVEIASPEKTDGKPFEKIKKSFQKNGVNGPGSKVRCAHKMIKNGFSIENAAQHPHCESVKYFLNKLKSLSN
jgi:Domain of unknown function (DUF4276)